MVACRNDDSTRNRKSVQATFVKNLLCQNSPFPLTIEGGAATMEVSFSGYGAKRSVRIHAADPGAVPGASTLPLPAKRQRNGGGEIASTRTIKGALGGGFLTNVFPVLISFVYEYVVTISPYQAQLVKRRRKEFPSTKDVPEAWILTILEADSIIRRSQRGDEGSLPRARLFCGGRRLDRASF